MLLDATAFFSDFAIDATVNGAAVRGIFDNAYAEAFGGMVSGSQPRLLVPSATAAARGQTVVIDAVSYTITAVEPDGTGVTSLGLDKA